MKKLFLLLTAAASIATAAASTSSVAAPDPDFDCAWRQLAYEYGCSLVPERGLFPDLFDALELKSLCGRQLPAAAFTAAGQSAPTVAKGFVVGDIFVDPAHGNDANSGSETQPLKTLQAAVDMRRAAPIKGSIVLRAGQHYLAATVALGPADNGIENVTVVGGQPMPVSEWIPLSVPTTRAQQCGLVPDPVDVTRDCGDYNIVPAMNMTECMALCCADAVNQCTMVSFNTPGPYCAGTTPCCHLKRGACPPTPNEYGPTVRTAALPPPPPATVFMAAVGGAPGAAVLGASWFASGNRLTLARYPNANPEIDVFPAGWVTSGHTWIPAPCSAAIMANVSVLNVAVPDAYPLPSGMFYNYTVGSGGSCDLYDPPSSYWCQPNGRTAGCTYFARRPVGIDAGATLPNAPYEHAEDGVLFTWRGGHWFSWMFQLGASNSSEFVFTRGGFQGGEGDTNAAEFYVAGVREELDALNEYYYDWRNSTLYVAWNGSQANAPPSSDVVFVAANLSQLITLANVSGALIQGITFSQSRATYLDPHGVPSGGDWALERSAAVQLENCTDILITGNTFTKLDSNALALNGYNRNITILRNEFSWLGQNGVTSWGQTTEDGDGTNGQQPRGINMLYNVVREIGLWQKQSSGWFQAKSCQNNVIGNVMFNMPRAAINFNDGFGGGTQLAGNLLFNTCRESSDHGAFNSWDRMPFVTDVKFGRPSAEPLYNDVHHNFIVANYAADGGCLDNDDGSSWYLIHDNFCLFGGHKNDFNGHSKRSYGNIHVYPSVYGNVCMRQCTDVPITSPDHYFDEGYWNNTCVLADNSYLDIGPFQGATPSALAVILGNNTVYAQDPGAVTVTTGHGVLTLQQFQAKGFDVNTQAFPLPSAQTIVAWGRALLFENSN